MHLWYIQGFKKPNPNLNSIKPVWVQEQFRFAIIFIDYFLKHYPYIYRRSDDETSDRSPSAARSHSPDASIIIQQIKKQIDQQSGQLFEDLLNRTFVNSAEYVFVSIVRT